MYSVRIEKGKRLDQELDVLAAQVVNLDGSVRPLDAFVNTLGDAVKKSSFTTIETNENERQSENYLSYLFSLACDVLDQHASTAYGLALKAQLLQELCDESSDDIVSNLTRCLCEDLVAIADRQRLV